MYKNLRGENFYRQGPDLLPDDLYVANEHLILFFSDYQYEIVQREEILYFDGKIYVPPTTYTQMITISFIRNNHVFPIVYALVKDKSLNTYLSIYRTLHHLKGELNPRIIKTDYEKASIRALQAFYPNAIISGCSCHLGQNIMRRLRRLWLNSEYNNRLDTRVKKYTKCLTALSFVDPNNLSQTFDSIKNSEDFPECLDPLYEYFFDTYIDPENAQFTPDLWNQLSHMSINVPRTNNSIEGFHRAFSKNFPSRASVALFTYYIRLEEERVTQKIFRSDSGEQFYRSNKYVTLERLFFDEFDRQTIKHGREYVFAMIRYFNYSNST